MWKRLLWQRSGGHYLFWLSAIYLTVGMVDVFYLENDYYVATQIFWLTGLALPFLCNPLARYLNMKETYMFNWFKKDKTPSNVVPFPEPKETPKMPYVVPPAPVPEQPAKIFYRIGVTDSNRVAFSMGMSEITMTKLGCQQMIEQIEVFMNQLHDENEHADSE